MEFTRKYDVKISEVNDKLIKMLRMVEDTIKNAITSLEERDTQLAKKTILDDKLVDALEAEIENDCLKLLLLEQPVAGDFRELSAALKMITDLERISDQARDICEIVLQFNKEEYIKQIRHIPMMANIAVEMVKNSVTSYINKDVAMARELETMDDTVDKLFVTVKNELVGYIQTDSENADQAILFMMIAKYVERIADHAVNIGEWVEYYITGKHRKY